MRHHSWITAAVASQACLLFVLTASAVPLATKAPSSSQSSVRAQHLMLVAGEETIREVMAFPKNNRGIDLMSQSPSDVDDRQLRKLGVRLSEEKKE